MEPESVAVGIFAGSLTTGALTLLYVRWALRKGEPLELGGFFAGGVLVWIAPALAFLGALIVWLLD